MMTAAPALALRLYAYFTDPSGTARPTTVAIDGYDALTGDVLVRPVGTDRVLCVPSARLQSLPADHVWARQSI